METKKWMKQYLTARKGNWLLVSICLIFTVFGISSTFNTDWESMPRIAAAIMGISGIFYLCSLLNDASKTRNWVQMMEREGNLLTALTDFRDAPDFLGGELKLGQYWCFGKGALVPIAYGEIVRVYQYVHKNNGTENRRALMAVTTTGATKELCELPLKGKGDQELNRALTFLLSKNPNIRIGYIK